jgi:hypothetical protein
MQLCINAQELRKALADIEAAEANGFMHCQAVFGLATAGPNLGDCTMNYSDMIERAHPFEPAFNWGRYQRVSARNKFKDGKLVPLSQ